MEEEKDFKSELLELIESIQDEDTIEYLYWYITLKLKEGN